ncbi:MAG: hypothetical protein WAT74_11395, partial [Flavobacteriales bacterium]
LWKLMDGDQYSEARATGAIARDRLALMPYLWGMKGKRVLVVITNKNGDRLLMGSLKTPAMVRVTRRKTGDGEQMESERNDYDIEFVLSSRLPVPFYQGEVPEPTQATCPNLCELLDDAIILGGGGDASAVTDCLSPEQAAVLLEALGGSSGECPTLCELIESAFSSGTSGMQLTVGAVTDAVPQSGTINGRLYYFNDAWGPLENYAEAYWGGSNWVCTDGVIYWISYDDVATPDLVTTWEGEGSPLPVWSLSNSGAETIANCVAPEFVAALIAALGGSAEGGTVLIRNAADSATLAEVDAGEPWIVPPIRIPYIDANGDTQVLLVYVDGIDDDELTVTNTAPPPIPRFRVFATNGTTPIAAKDITDPNVSVPQSVRKFKDENNDSQVTAASDTEFSSGTLRAADETPRRQIFVGGTGTGIYATEGRLIADTLPAIPRKVSFDFEQYSNSVFLTVRADFADTYTVTANDGSSGTITFSKNGGAFAAFSSPLVLANGDTIEVRRTTTSAAGWVTIATA